MYFQIQLRWTCAPSDILLLHSVLQLCQTCVLSNILLDMFVYWSGLVRTGTKSIRLLVRLGSDHSIVGLGRNHLLRDLTVLKWFGVELSNTRSTEWYWNASNCLFTANQSEPK
jgi:hypothetical protein